MTSYAIVNHSMAPELTHAWLAETANDTQTAYDTVFAPARGVLPADIRVGITDATDRVVEFVDVLDDPQALAYHTVDAQGRPVLKVGVTATRSEGGNFLDNLTEAFTHEVWETTGNPYVNLYVDHGGAIAGKPDVCRELGDPVQGSGWRCGSTWMANFTLPAWEDAGDADGPYDHTGVLSKPFQCASGGYLAFRDNTQTFGDRVSASRRASLEKYARHLTCNQMSAKLDDADARHS